VLDKWILSRLVGSIEDTSKSLERYDAAGAVESAEIFVVNDLSNWYVRRIRDRVGPTVKDGEDKDEAYQTLWIILTTYLKVLAPMIPYATEEMYTNLTREESVHLTDWPKVEFETDKELEKGMGQVRKLAEIGHSLRKEQQIKVRQPLKLFKYGKKYTKLPREFEELLEDELNVKKVTFDNKHDFDMDWELTLELEKEGEARDLIRSIQEKRKEAKVTFDSFVIAYAPEWPKEFEDLIKRETLTRKLIKGETVKVEKPKSE
jgi:isoleucyl-tRNA synthetase